MALLLAWGEETDFSCACAAETVFLCCIIVFDIVFVVVIEMYQNLDVMVTSFGCCLYSGVPPRVPVV